MSLKECYTVQIDVLDQATFFSAALFSALLINYTASLKMRTPKNEDFCDLAKEDLSKKSGLSPKIPTHASPDFKRSGVYYFHQDYLF